MEGANLPNIKLLLTSKTSSALQNMHKTFPLPFIGGLLNCVTFNVEKAKQKIEKDLYFCEFPILCILEIFKKIPSLSAETLLYEVFDLSSLKARQKNSLYNFTFLKRIAIRAMLASRILNERPACSGYSKLFEARNAVETKQKNSINTIKMKGNTRGNVRYFKHNGKESNFDFFYNEVVSKISFNKLKACKGCCLCCQNTQKVLLIADHFKKVNIETDDTDAFLLQGLPYTVKELLRIDLKNHILKEEKNKMLQKIAFLSDKNKEISDKLIETKQKNREKFEKMKDFFDSL